MPGSVDYALARRAVLRQLSSGSLTRLEVCDAHPDLVRAAKYCGEKTSDACPVCDNGSLTLVRYVFSDEFPKRENGRVVPHGDLGPLLRYREVRLYVVEVCTDCSWNHLRSQLTVGHAGSGGGTRRPAAARKGRRAST